MSRYRAGLTHLALSALVAALVFVPIYFLWFPGVLFEGAGGRELFFLITGVDVTLGPVITTIVFRSGKKGLKFDLAVIAVLQLAALSYGVYNLFEARPVYIAYVKDRFELVRANDVEDANLEKARAKGHPGRLPLLGPQVVGAKIPKDVNESFDVMMSGFAGKDVQTYPQYHVPYDEVRDLAKQKSLPIGRLRELNPDRVAEVEASVAGSGFPEAQVRFLPMRAGKRDLTVLIHAGTGEVLRITSFRPWQY